jgi:eukaryotic-like serine/threonine-protein kinase
MRWLTTGGLGFMIGNFGLQDIALQFAIENQESRIRNLKFPPLAGLKGLLAGRVLAGRYRIEEVIGRGGMGAVYRAVDECLGRPVAVKVINVAVSDPKQAKELRTRFQREARVAASLHHPNVIIVYDFGTDPELGLDFLVMELLHGEDLANRMARSGPPSLSTSLRILWEAGRGLAVGHRTGLIHRDVKPGNLFLEEDDGLGELRVRVVDFGIARVVEEQEAASRITRFDWIALSPAYASPEQLRNEPNLTPASDVFSLGAIGYELLTGERLSSREGTDRLADGDPQPVPSIRDRNCAVSPALEAVIRRALAFDPKERLPHAGAFLNALNAAAQGGIFEVAHLSASPPAIARDESVSTQVPSVLAPPATAARRTDPAAPTVVVPQLPPAAFPPVGTPVAPGRIAPQRGRPCRHAGRHRTPLARCDARLLGALLLLGIGAIPVGSLFLGDEEGTRAERASAPSDAVPIAPPILAETVRIPTNADKALSTPRTSDSTVTVSPESAVQPTPLPPTEPVQLSGPPWQDPRPTFALPGEQLTRSAPSSKPLPRPTSRLERPGTAQQEREATTRPAPRAADGSASRANLQGVRLFAQENLAAAREQFQRATELAPRNAEYHNNYGWVLFRLGEVEAAERELEETLRLNPRRNIAHANLGEVHFAQGNTAAAIAAYERFLKLNTDPRRERIAEEKLRRIRP